MKNENVTSYPNDTIAIICKLVKDDKNMYSIVPLEVAYGKIDNELGEFLCADNNSFYKPLDFKATECDSEQKFFAFPKSVADLKVQYGDKLNINVVMISYLKDVLSMHNFAEVKKDQFNIHCIPRTEIDSRTDDPLYETYNSRNYSSSTATKTSEFPAPAVDLKGLPKSGKLVNPLIELIDLEDFIKFMSERIVKNDETLESLCTRIAMNFAASTQDQVHNILSIGPTGSGKSQTFKTMREYLDIPIVMCDCNELSAAGYVGKSVDDFLLDIYLAAKGNEEAANRAIFVLDEIDKLKRSNLEMKEAAQDTLLKVIEGQVYTFEVDKKYGTKAKLDTGWMTVVGCGAFSEIFEKRQGGGDLKKPIGFVTDLVVSTSPKVSAGSKEMLERVSDDELRKYGFKTEFIPRFQKRYTYRALDEEGLRHALLYSKNSPLIHNLQNYLEKFYCEVEYDDSFIDAIVSEAIKLEQGGRSLVKTVASAFDKADTAVYIQHFKDKQAGEVKKRTLKLTGDTVLDPKKFDLK